jgi:hypothetical protein
MKKRTIGLPLAFAVGVMLILIGLEVGIATGLMPISLNSGKGGTEIKTSSNYNLAMTPANCNLIGLVPELECHDYLTGGTSFSIPIE